MIFSMVTLFELTHEMDPPLNSAVSLYVFMSYTCESLQLFADIEPPERYALLDMKVELDTVRLCEFDHEIAPPSP